MHNFLNGTAMLDGLALVNVGSTLAFEHGALVLLHLDDVGLESRRARGAKMPLAGRSSAHVAPVGQIRESVQTDAILPDPFVYPLNGNAGSLRNFIGSGLAVPDQVAVDIVVLFVENGCAIHAHVPDVLLEDVAA